jgi:hypothetical protein
MTIRESTLDRWTNYETAAIETAKKTHHHIRDRLEADDSRLNNRGEMSFKTFLQGSYRNNTIIHGSSDVDIVVKMTNPYKGNLSILSDRRRKLYKQEAHYFDGSYSLADFQEDVYEELKDIYGYRAVERYDKAVVVDEEHCQLSLSADIVPSQEYRVYKRFNGDQNNEDAYYQGIRFKSQKYKIIKSYPKRHIDHGERKNKSCDGNYKETVRMIKNARDWLVEHDRLNGNDAMSYHIECLLYNVPSAHFATNDLQDRFGDIASYLSEDANLRAFKTQDGLDELFGHGETQWKRRDAHSFIQQLVKLYNDGTRQTTRL